MNQKILIIKLSEKGAWILAYPAIAELKKTGGDLYFLVFEESRPILEALGLTNIIGIRQDSVMTLLTDGWKAVRTLCRLKLNACIDFDFFSRFSAVLAYLICRGERVGFHAYMSEGLYRGDLMTRRVLYSPQRHASVHFLTLVRSLLAEPSTEPYYKGFVKIPDVNELPLWKAKQKTHDKKIVLLNPNSSDAAPYRTWPTENFVHLGRRILSECDGVQVILTGSPSEKENNEIICSALASSDCINMAGKTSFTELLDLYSSANVLVTNDSGPAHFASLTRLPTIVFLGPAAPEAWKPLGDHVTVLYQDFACSPCMTVYNQKSSPCRDNLCLKTISPESVFEEVKKHV